MLTDFKRLMSARFFFTFAVQMQAVVIGWRMYDLTHDPLFLGLIGLTEAIPALSLALYGGYIVDRSNPLRVYRRVMEGSLLSGLVLFFSQFPLLSLATKSQVFALFVASFVTGVARAFSQPAIYATVPRIVARSELAKASAWMTSAMHVAMIAGPGLGGLVFGYLGASFAAGLVCMFLLFGRLALARVQFSPPPPKPAEDFRELKKELVSGAVFVFRHPILLPALTLDMISVLFGGVTALLPIYAAEILHVGPKGLGLLRAAPAFGAVLMSIWLTRRDIPRAGAVLFGSVAGFGVSILVFGLSHDFLLSLIALGLSGAFDGVSMVIRSAAVQLSSPDDMRGRISAVNSMFIGSSNEIGEFESGVVAKLLGTVPAVVLGGVVCLLTVAGVAILSPALRRLDLRSLHSEQ